MNNLKNTEMFITAAWGAATKDVKGDHLFEYSQIMERRSCDQFNDPEQSTRATLLDQISQSLRNKPLLDNLLIIPWSLRRLNVTRTATHLMAFTDDNGRYYPSEFFDVEKIWIFLSEVRKRFEDHQVRLRVPEQLSISLSLADNNPIAASLLAHTAFRSIARNCDTRVDPRLRFPVYSDNQTISMINLTDSVADFDLPDTVNDPLGNTYHFWSQFTAGMAFTIERRTSWVPIFYTALFRKAPELTDLVRRRLGRKLQRFGNHREADRLGMRLGQAAGNLIVKKTL